MIAMLTLLDIWSECLKLKQEATALDSDIKFRKFMRAYRAKFDPDQPRDDRGRWTDGGSTSGDDGGSDAEVRGGEGDGLSDSAPRLDLYAARRRYSLAECESQFTRDTFHCHMVGLPSCHRQAAQRYGACLAGTQIPPLSY